MDVDGIAQIAGPEWNGETIVYAYRTGEVVRLPKGASLPVTLKVLEYELFHVSPLKVRLPKIERCSLINLLKPNIR